MRDYRLCTSHSSRYHRVATSSPLIVNSAIPPITRLCGQKDCSAATSPLRAQLLLLGKENPQCTGFGNHLRGTAVQILGLEIVLHWQFAAAAHIGKKEIHARRGIPELHRNGCRNTTRSSQTIATPHLHPMKRLYVRSQTENRISAMRVQFLPQKQRIHIGREWIIGAHFLRPNLGQGRIPKNHEETQNAQHRRSCQRVKCGNRRFGVHRRKLQVLVGIRQS